MTPRYLVRETPFRAVAEPILSLWARHLHGMTPESAAEKLRHWYEENPAGGGACVVLQASGEASPVGVQCLMERLHWNGAAPVKSAGLAEFAIDPAHRSLGPALSLLKKCLEIGRARYGLVYGMPNPNAFSVCRRAGLVHVGDMTRFVVPLRLGLVLRRRGSAGWLRIFQSPADAVLRAAAALRASVHRAPRRWRDTSLDDPALEQVWSRRPSYVSLCERSNRALRWRFGGETGWRVTVAEGADAAPFGYVVWRPEEGFAQIGDFLCADPDTQTAALLSGFVRHVRSRTDAGAVAVIFCGRPSVVQGIRRAGFMGRNVMCPLVFDRAPEGAAAAIERIYFTKFDRVSD